MKKFYYTTNENHECLNECPFKVRKRNRSGIIRLGSILCKIECEYKDKMYNDEFKYVYCNHPSTNNRNKANR